MTVTLKGFQGTITDADMATMFPHHMPTVQSAADLLVTAGANRQLSIATGTAHGPFLRYANDGAGFLQLPQPTSGGKWYAVTLDRQWSPTNTVTLKADDLAVGNDGTIPTIPSLAAISAAAALPNQPGTAGSTAGQRQVLALVHVRASDTTLTIFDMRARRTGAGNVSFTTLYGLLYALAAGMLADGAVASVGTHTLPSGGKHLRSTWQRTGTGSYVTENVGKISVDESTATGGNTARGDIRNLIFLVTANGLNPGGEGVVDSSTGTVWRWNGGIADWLAWEGKGTISAAPGSTVYGQEGASGYNQEFTTELRRAGRVCTLSLSINTGGNGISQGGGIIKLPVGWRGLASRQQRGVMMVGYANEQGEAWVHVNGDTVSFYQWNPAYQNGPNGQLPANTALSGTITYIAEE